MIDASLKSLVWARAKDRCEYCQLHQEDSDFLSFYIEHIIARQHGGLDEADNLCLACSECSWAKGPNLTGLLYGKLYPLFNPHKQRWKSQFYWNRSLLVGKSRSGIVTIQVLNINVILRVLLRDQLGFEERLPPKRLAIRKAAAIVFSIA